ncbi:prepilin-type N-terminal cleavage/methylation domain-containing protein [Saccharococcus sp. Marseille-Q5394]|uniref:type IV pilus modification PilV family protein n=1 Tax=Saccharococcus sp. Marseille-Q5394 TaxID=2972778 RepID=UPI0021C5DF21|nr:prepilin-type N-terminal cleavage/methylation domain-containing protein [Saccharococcus sp. Marseille-Q5394]
MKNKLKSYLVNNRGMSLIEVLASLVILTIIFVSLSHFFFQASLFSVKVEDQLTSINIAEKVLHDVKTSTVKSTGKNVSIDGKQYKEINPTELNGKLYYPYVLVSPETPAILQLERVHVKIYAEKIEPGYEPVQISEIFGYNETGNSK